LRRERSYLALSFGPDMPDLPGGTVILHRRQDPASRALDPSRIGLRRCDWIGGQRSVDHGLHRLRAAENLARLAQPGLLLFGGGAGLVFGVAGFQGGLLGQFQRVLMTAADSGYER
jgi:hypothetical protein